MGSGSKNGLFYSLLRDNSSDVAAACMLRVAKFSSRWLSNMGMSIGISDVMPFEVLNKAKKDLLEAGYNNCDKLIDDYNQGKLSLKAGCDAA
jgi:DNA-directed RNA polymerase III subunit RPC1